MPENEDFYHSLSNYLRPVSEQIELSLPIPLCFDHGRAAAMDGKTEAANPFIAEVEPEQHAAWQKGFASGQSTRTIREGSILMPPDFDADVPPDDATQA